MIIKLCDSFNSFRQTCLNSFRSALDDVMMGERAPIMYLDLKSEDGAGGEFFMIIVAVEESLVALLL